MKKLLIIALLVITGINCQAQQKIHYDKANKMYVSGNTIWQARVIADSNFVVLYAKIDSLQKRIIELENNCLVMKVDSTVFGYEYIFWETDSTKMIGNPTYTKQYKVVTFTERNK